MKKKKQNKTKHKALQTRTAYAHALLWGTSVAECKGIEAWMWISVKTMQSKGVGMYEVYDTERKQGEEALSGL